MDNLPVSGVISASLQTLGDSSDSYLSDIGTESSFESRITHSSSPNVLTDSGATNNSSGSMLGTTGTSNSLVPMAADRDHLAEQLNAQKEVRISHHSELFNLSVQFSVYCKST